MDKKIYTKAEMDFKFFDAQKVIVASAGEIEPPSQENDDLPIT